ALAIAWGARGPEFKSRRSDQLSRTIGPSFLHMSLHVSVLRRSVAPSNADGSPLRIVRTRGSSATLQLRERWGSLIECAAQRLNEPRDSHDDGTGDQRRSSVHSDGRL